MAKYTSIILGLLMLLVVPFFLKNSDGEPMMTMDFVKNQLAQGLEPFKDLKEHVEDETGMAGPAPGSGVYKWQDENGKWHFGDMAVEGAEEVKISTQMNIVQLPSGVSEDEEEASGDSRVTILRDSSKADDDLSLSANPIERIKQGLDMKDQAKDLGKQIEARNEALDQMLAQ